MSYHLVGYLAVSSGLGEHNGQDILVDQRAPRPFARPKGPELGRSYWCHKAKASYDNSGGYIIRVGRTAGAVFHSPQIVGATFDDGNK